MGSSEIVKKKVNIQGVEKAIEQIKAEIGKVIVGQDDMIEFLIASLLAGGHVLLEGVPGIAKTVTAKLLSMTLDVGFSRIQFTPDLMPSDVLGTSIFNTKKSDFEFKKGPLFSNIILIDEINRSPAKTQSALFEVMEERQITADGTTYQMDEPYMVVATQNPIEYEGTYRLPEAQIDRFLFKIKVDYPSLDEEMTIMLNAHGRKDSDMFRDIKKVLDSKKIMSLRGVVKSIHIDENIIRYIAEIVHSTRNNSSIFLGASPRASLAVMEGAKAFAIIQSRDFVIPEDIQAVVYPALRHRIILTPEKEMEGKSTDDIIGEIVEKIEVPR